MRIIKLEKAEDVTQAALKDVSDAIQSGNAVLLGHATWCGHCIRMASQWVAFKKMAANNKNLKVIEMESNALSAVMKKNPALYKKLRATEGGRVLEYYPTIISYKKAASKRVYEGERTAEAIMKFIGGNMDGGAMIATMPKPTPKANASKTVAAVKKPAAPQNKRNIKAVVAAPKSKTTKPKSTGCS